MFSGRVRYKKQSPKPSRMPVFLVLLVSVHIRQDLSRDASLSMSGEGGQVIQATDLKGWRHLK